MPASSSAATVQTATNHTSGVEACLASSSSGSACRMRGPGRPAARTAYNQPMVETPTASASGGTASLRPTDASEVLARGQVSVGRVAAPERPVVAPVHDAEPMCDPVLLELRDERLVLAEEAIVAAAVEPEEGVGPPQRRRGGPERVERRVQREERAFVTEDRAEVVGLLVARPALDEAELAGMVDRDVDRAVTALRQAADPASAIGADRAETSVHGPDEIVRDERLPPFVQPDTVRPLPVDERSGRAERHHQNQRTRAVQRRQLVIDDAEPDRHQESTRPTERAVQREKTRVALPRVRPVAGRQVDVDGLPTASERCARDLDPDRPPEEVDESRVV